MNFFYILISFALVNILVALDELTKQVIMINKQMMYARDYLPDVIQNLVLFDNFKMVELAVMLSVPEAETDTAAAEEEEDFIYYVVNNKLRYQQIVRDKIELITSISAPVIDEELYKDAWMSGLGIERRGMTLVAIKTLIRAVISGDNQNFHEFFDLCRLIGTFRSIKFAPEFVQDAKIDEKGQCVLTDIFGNTSRYFYSIEGNIWEIFQSSIALQALAFQVKHV
ncbi:uncharacterized protein LOC126832811 [Adelges cooleyi]|uniref:uncharacterized protein LOC126832811 n=1 Tax=Adelges cooleyi TaxID=133065 RepID=UPI00217F8A2A|nr:uncharacterized protein LOC126832811 [Adelges cooleyi]